jgi:general L-amino acid transport system permease protein
MSTAEIIHTLLFGFPVPEESIDSAWPEGLQRMGGMSLSVGVTFVSLAGGLPLAALLAAGRERRGAILRWASVASIEGIRGLPIMILILLAFYLPFPLFGLRIPGVILAALAFVLYAAAYGAEILRSGFRAVEDATLDAARVLGLSGRQILFDIKLPIALRTMLPALLGLAITVFKDTSVLVVVAVPELTYTARQLTVAQPVDHLLVLFLLLLFYGLCTWAASALVRQLEHRLHGGLKS